MTSPDCSDPNTNVGPGQPPSSTSPRPAYRQWRFLGLVAAGGAVGTGLREIITLLAPGATVFPTAIFAINLSGAFLLGLFLELLPTSRPDEGTRRRVRLLVGTGILGGFTTYSALATTTAVFALQQLPWWSLLYGLGTIFLGTGLSAAGIVLGRLATSHRKHRS